MATIPTGITHSSDGMAAAKYITSQTHVLKLYYNTVKKCGYPAKKIGPPYKICIWLFIKLLFLTKKVGFR